MFLYLNEYGYRVSKNKEFLELEHPNGTIENFCTNDISAAYFAGEGRISKAIILELAEKNIDIVLLSRSGKPMAYLYPAWTKPKCFKMLEKQAKLDIRTKDYFLKLFVLRAIRYKAKVLSELSRSRKRTNKEIAGLLAHEKNKIRDMEKKVRKINRKNCDDFRGSLMGLEGYSARIYFNALKYVIPKKFNYEGMRTRRPPKDLFNASVSYGYAYLKSFIEKAILLKGVNPYFGYLHGQAEKTQHFLAFDMMEGYRHVFIDKAVLNLIAKKKLVSEKHSAYVNGGILLNSSGRKIVSKAIYDAYFSKFRMKIYEDIDDFISIVKENYNKLP